MPEPGAGPASVSSTSVFHSLHAAHLPCQRDAVAPQLWQTKTDLDGFAMGEGIADSSGGGEAQFFGLSPRAEIRSAIRALPPPQGRASAWNVVEKGCPSAPSWAILFRCAFPDRAVAQRQAAIRDHVFGCGHKCVSN